MKPNYFKPLARLVVSAALVFLAIGPDSGAQDRPSGEDPSRLILQLDSVTHSPMFIPEILLSGDNVKNVGLTADSALLKDRTRDFERRREAARSVGRVIPECDPAGPKTLGTDWNARNLEQLLPERQYAAKGRVVAVVPGWFQWRERVARMVYVEVGEVLFDRSEAVKVGELIAFELAGGVIQVNGYRVCSEVPQGEPEVGLGEELIVIADRFSEDPRYALGSLVFLISGESALPFSYSSLRSQSQIPLAALSTLADVAGETEAPFAVGNEGAAGTAIGDATEAEVPHRLSQPSENGTKLIWLAADEIGCKDNGEIDWPVDAAELAGAFGGLLASDPLTPEQFESMHGTISARVLETETEGGRSQVLYFGPDWPEDSMRARLRDFDEAADTARIALVGRVVGVREGFFFETAGSLIAIEVEESLVGSAAATGSRAYLYFPQADFLLCGTKVRKSSRTYSPRAEPGDRILVLSEQPPLGEGANVITARSNTVVAVPPGHDELAEAVRSFSGEDSFAALIERAQGRGFSRVAAAPGSVEGAQDSPTRPDTQIPETLAAPWATAARPGWVREDFALEVDGERISVDRFHSETLTSLTELLSRRAEDGCIPYGEVRDEIVNPPLRGDLRSALETSVFSFRGEVLAKAGGFLGGIPGTLVRVKPSEVFHREATVFEAPSYLVFLPVGSVRVGTRTICKTDRAYAELPAVGDELVVFVPRHWRTATSELLDIIDEQGAITVRADGRVSLPSAMNDRQLEVNSRDALYAELRRLVKDGSP